MNEQRLNKMLENVPNYLGSFAVDELSAVQPKDHRNLFVINLDERAGVGSHWIAVAIDLKNVYICDSLGGISPTKFLSQSWINFLYLLSQTRRIHITKQLQHINSDLCGLYCILFVREMINGTFDEFLRLFTPNKKTNDDLVQFLVYKGKEK